MVRELGDSYHCHHIFLITTSMVQTPLLCPLRSHLAFHLPCSSVGGLTHFLVSLLLIQLATNWSFCSSLYLSSSCVSISDLHFRDSHVFHGLQWCSQVHLLIFVVF
jgi:hypothetical protein